MKLYGVSSTGRVLKFVYVFVHAVGGAAPLHSPRKTLRQRQPKKGSVGLVLGKPPLIADTSSTICTRFNSRTAPLCPNLDCNLCPTLTAHSEPLPFSELAETRVQASYPYLRRVLA